MTIEESLVIIRQCLGYGCACGYDASISCDHAKLAWTATHEIESELKRIRGLHREEQRRSADRLRECRENAS